MTAPHPTDVLQVALLRVAQLEDDITELARADVFSPDTMVALASHLRHIEERLAGVQVIA